MSFLKTMFRSFLLGLGVGLLVAPRAGAETRRLLSEKLNRLVEGATPRSSLDYSAAEGGASAAVVPKQAYADAAEQRSGSAL
ncbi:hypothetical protein [Kallotenue papyrolyticum]|uniref:hypothetical protein n=1 Tax=Kallotenue papyrolyticum TaxID=1325125 RepID=UPI0004785C6D|nr:hypothetical protein [Kallotenue papyrolyticum]